MLDVALLNGSGSAIRGFSIHQRTERHSCPPAVLGAVAMTERHLPSVIYRRRLRDLLRKTYWVKCWHCDLNRGPFDRGFSYLVRVDQDFQPCPAPSAPVADSLSGWEEVQ